MLDKGSARLTLKCESEQIHHHLVGALQALCVHVLLQLQEELVSGGAEWVRY